MPHHRNRVWAGVQALLQNDKARPRRENSGLARRSGGSGASGLAHGTRWRGLLGLGRSGAGSSGGRVARRGSCRNLGGGGGTLLALLRRGGRGSRRRVGRRLRGLGKRVAGGSREPRSHCKESNQFQNKARRMADLRKVPVPPGASDTASSRACSASSAEAVKADAA